VLDISAHLMPPRSVYIKCLLSCVTRAGFSASTAMHGPSAPCATHTPTPCLPSV
jgi:hypothetical protein